MTSVHHSRPRTVADVSEGLILATVDIAAPPERVFRALASKDIAEWWGEEGVYRVTEWTGDVRVGGAWRSSGVGADGKSFSVGGEFVEVDAPRKLVHTWKPEWAPGKPTTVTYRLEAIEGGTRLTVRHEGFESSAACESHTQGWGRVLGWLVPYAGGKPRSMARSYFLLRLLPPRPTFAFDMNDDERRVMGQHAAYWGKLLEEGVAVAFGPVGDPNGPWGLGVVEVDDPAVLPALEANDPATTSGLGLRYEVLPMLRAVVRPR
jgi:uncharacterized protein YndB with AHSA1/START domain